MNKLKVLLIEDNDADILMFKMALKKLNIKCDLEISKTVANSADKLKDFTPDIIFLDVNLPDESGVNLLRKDEFKKLFEKIPVIMLTSMGDINLINTCYSLNAKYFLLKTSSVLDLSHKIRKEIIDAKISLLFNNVEELSNQISGIIEK